MARYVGTRSSQHEYTLGNIFFFSRILETQLDQAMARDQATDLAVVWAKGNGNRPYQTLG